MQDGRDTHASVIASSSTFSRSAFCVFHLLQWQYQLNIVCEPISDHMLAVIRTRCVAVCCAVPLMYPNLAALPAEHIGSKTAVQIRSHAQKFFSKMERRKEAGDSEIPGALPAPMRHLCSAALHSLSQP